MKLKPKNEQRMPCPKIVTEHPGLDYLVPLNELIVAQKLDALHEVIIKTGIGYTIFNGEGQKVFLAVQKKNCRKLVVKFFNFYGNEVIVIKKPFALFSNKVLVWAPPGNYVGYVEKILCHCTLLVKNRTGQVILKIKGRKSCGFAFDVLSGDELVGRISNGWAVRAVIDYKHLGVSFPTQLDVEDKAMLLGACFLIGLKYCA